MAAIVIIVAGLIWLVEAPALRKKKQKKELWAFYIMLASGTIAGIAKALDLPMFNPLELITFLFQPASNALMKLLT